MNVFFWLRALAALVLRFILLLAIGVFYQNFEVSPLPAWTLTAFACLLLFLATYLCARWIYGKVLPTRRTLCLVLVLFLVVQTIAEPLVYFGLTRAPLEEALKGYSIMSVVLLGWHALAILAAYYQKRRRILRAVAPEGLVV